ncbi:MAG: hypothetical protein KatS3mg061_0646 [Dehalococcoidia bacterium]|nr:MAG: hypothetical protein KatS3mg061_0646 [Dehalococcoidia bacterium]
MVTASPSSRPADDTSYRLPRTVLPRRYHLRLAPDLASASFHGEETIDLQVQEPVREIVLNAAELTIERVQLTDGQRTLRGNRAAGRDPRTCHLTVRGDYLAGNVATPARVCRHPQRQAPGLLS